MKNCITFQCVKHGLIQSFKSGTNYVLFGLTCLLFYWSLSRYSSTGNFDLLVTTQWYITSVSLVSLLTGLIKDDPRYTKLTIFAVIAIFCSLLTILGGKVINSIINEFFLVTNFFGFFLFLQQLKIIVQEVCKRHCKPHDDNH